MALVTQYVRVNCCWNGTVVTYVSTPQGTPSITTLRAATGWSLEGVRPASQCNHFVNGQMWRATTTTQYEYCALKVGCIQKLFSGSRQDVYNFGLSSVASGK